MEMIKNIRGDRGLRESFMALAGKTFGLSFSDWYEKGYWTDRYVPYAFTDRETVVANASVNIMDTLWNGEPKRYIQIGTVMTDPAYRGKGLARRLIEEILNDYQGCDAVYLFANDTVLDFYPKFGFVKADEYQYATMVTPHAGNLRKLEMTEAEDVALLKKYYEKSNPFSRLPMVGNFGLLMFYCSSVMKDCVYYCEEFDAAVIAEYDGKTMICHDIYCDGNKPFTAVLAAASKSETERVVLGFTPKGHLADFTVNVVNSDDNTLFIHKGKENIFSENKLIFPTLSHA